MKQAAFVMMILLTPAVLYPQHADTEVAKYLTMIQNGQADRVKAEIPALLDKYPNDPGVLYLQAQTTSEGAEAVRIYQSIVDNFPTSEWAPEALFRVYQFYYALGLYRTAEMKMAQLKKNYPSSKHTLGVPEADTRQIPDENAQPPVNGVKPTSEGHDVTAASFTLQVGAYTTQMNAEKQKAFFEGQGYTVETINRVKDNRSLFFVLVGSYTSVEEAKAKGQEIKKQFNIDSMVTTK